MGAPTGDERPDRSRALHVRIPASNQAADRRLGPEGNCEGIGFAVAHPATAERAVSTIHPSQLLGRRLIETAQRARSLRLQRS